jgi:UDP-galactopyranose mutase
MKAVILGGGFAGCTVAHLLHRAGWQTTLIEREQNLGGGCRTFFHAGHPFTWGPRVYYGYSQKVFEWLNKVVPIRKFPFELRTLAHEPVDKDRKFWHYPPHELEIEDMPRAEAIAGDLGARDNSVPPQDFEQYWVQKVGPTLYDMFVDHYSKKMWMIGDNKLFDVFKWSAKDRPIETGGRGAYKDSILGYPISPDGYNAYFDEMTEGTEVILGEKAEVIWMEGEHKVVCPSGDFKGADVVISTIPVDELCSYRFGELPYVGREFHLLVLPAKQVFPGDVRFCHYASDRDEWTRVTEFKKLTYHESESTLLVLEKPSKVNKLYPYVTKANEALAKKYLESLPPKVHSIGRLGTYKYSTIEQTIVQAFQCAAKLLGKVSDEGCEGEWKGIGDVAMMKDRKET